MRLHGAEAGQEEDEVGKRRDGGGRGGDRSYETTSRGDARYPRSPNPRKRRAVAADLFDDDDDDDEDHEQGRSSAPRSRSPPPGTASPQSRDHKRQRHRDRDHHEGRRRRHHNHHHHTKHPDPTVELPFDARRLSYKHDFDVFTALFAYYLDIQKNLDYYALDSHEARGRWKSFVHRWNRGELAEGWYDPEMYERVTRDDPARMAPPAREYSTGGEGDEGGDEDQKSEGGVVSGDGERPEGTTVPPPPPGQREDDEDDVDDYGPPPPPGQAFSSSDAATTGGGGAGGPQHGPGIPTRADLALQREAAAEAAESSLAALRLARKADRAQQKERLDDVAPRAEAGTRERMLEKKALVNDKMRAFRDNKGGGDTMEEVGDGELMGGGAGGEDDLAAYKRLLATQQRKKTERELRREAEARAKAAEREARLQEWREREEEKLKGLKELARARFG